MRSGWLSRLAAFVQSRRCTETPFSRVTKPRISSPGSGVQHLASFTHMSESPATMMPTSLLARALREGAEPIRLSSRPAVAASSTPPSVSSSRWTTLCALTLPSPIAA